MTINIFKPIILILFMMLPPHLGLADTKVNEFTLLYSNNVNGETEPCG